jgi:hypothetical protein
MQAPGLGPGSTLPGDFRFEGGAGIADCRFSIGGRQAVPLQVVGVGLAEFKGSESQAVRAEEPSLPAPLTVPGAASWL